MRGRTRGRRRDGVPLELAVAEPTDEFTLLCESCGYPLTGLATAGRCPECGQPIAESVPERRPGSAWQRQPSLRSWLATNADAIRRPVVSFRAMRVETERSGLLFVVNITAASLVVALGVSYGLFWDDWLSGCFAALLVAFVVWIVLAVLTLIEYGGVQFFGSRSRWRVTPSVAWSVCAHSTVGWLVGAIGGGLAFALWTWRINLDRLLPLAIEFALLILIAAGPMSGLIIFETLVYIGIRRCRFANRIPPAPHA